MNEMIQEAVLDSIESIEEQQLIAEYNVINALLDTYLKSAIIQESSGLVFDGYDVIQEATGDDATTDTGVKDEPGVKVRMGRNGKYRSGDNLIQRVIKFIKGLFRAIMDKIRSKKLKKITTDEAAAIVDNGGEIEFKSVEAAERLGLPMKPTAADLKNAFKGAVAKDEPGTDVKMNTSGKYSSNKSGKTIETKDVIIRYNLSINVHAFETGFDYMKKSFNEFQTAIQPTYDAQAKGHLNDAEQYRQSAMHWWGGAYERHNKKTLQELTEIELMLSGAASTIDTIIKTLDKCEKELTANTTSNMSAAVFDMKSEFITYIQKAMNTANTGNHIQSVIYKELRGAKAAADDTPIGPKYKPSMASV